MNIYEVFTPAGVPTVTYIDREDQKLEQQLRTAIRTPGQIASLSGPSKSGKTVLINKVIEPDNLIAVSGAAITNADMLWDRVLTWMEAPSETSITASHSLGAEASGKASAKAGVIVASAQTEGSLTGRYGYERSRQTNFARGGIDQVIKEIAHSDFVVFVDDFHYMPRETQHAVAKQMKEAAEKGVCICTARSLTVPMMSFEATPSYAAACARSISSIGNRERRPRSLFAASARLAWISIPQLSAIYPRRLSDHRNSCNKSACKPAST